MAVMARTWWGQRFLAVLERQTDRGRLQRGRAYSNDRRLLKFSIDGTTVKATVRGNINPYFGVYEEPRYKATVKIRGYGAAKWSKITDAICDNASFLSQLLMNEMPDRIDEVLANDNLSLLPQKNQDLIGKCSCPDYGHPCKHIAGVYYRIAQLLDRDPMLLFQLRGLDFATFKEQLSNSPLGKSLIEQMEETAAEIKVSEHKFTQPDRTPLTEVDLASFWKSEQPLPRVDPVNPNSVTPAVLVKRGGDYPNFWHENVSFVEIMETISRRIVEQNKASL